MSKLEEFKAAKERFEKVMVEAGKEVVREVLEDFLKRNPEVGSVRWTQYTPYFNDGDACTFGIHEPMILLQAPVEGQLRPEKDRYDYDGYYDAYNFKRESVLYDELQKLHKAMYVILKPLEMALGDHVQVTVALSDGKVKFEVEEYSHD